MTVGGRNLVILGIVSVAIAFTTTGVALAVYHNSGDIYLDRSRPGFLPDADEIQDDSQEEEYEFDINGTVTKESLDEYLKKFKEEIEAVDAYTNPFSSEALSDERLGI